MTDDGDELVYLETKIHEIELTARSTACSVNWLWILYRIPALFAQFPELIELPVMYWLALRPATTLVLT
jgi:hypothetical protein